MSSENAHIITYRGVQFGTEAFIWDANPVGTPARITTPLGTARAHAGRRTPGQHTRHQFTIHLLGRSFAQAPALIEQWGQMIDGQPGELRVFRGSAQVASIPDALLERVQAQSSPSPAAGRARVIAVDFVTASTIE